MAELPDMTLHLLSRITPERRAELEKLVPSGRHIVFHNGVTDAEYENLAENARRPWSASPGRRATDCRSLKPCRTARR
jgi:hypothetical protein